MGKYEADFYGWANEQAGLLRAGRLQEADIANIAEEIDSMGRSEKRELVSRLAVVLTHLLKWQAQPECRGRSWELTLQEQRSQLETHLEDNPSLKAALPASLARAYKLAVLVAQRETNLERSAFPPVSPWTARQAMNEDFYPA